MKIAVETFEIEIETVKRIIVGLLSAALILGAMIGFTMGTWATLGRIGDRLHNQQKEVDSDGQS